MHLPINPCELRSREIAAEIVASIARQHLQDGDWLPSTRTLAGELGCSRTMVATAYDELIAAGFLEGLAGRGTRVTAGAAAAAAAGLSSRTPALSPSDTPRHQSVPAATTVDLRPGYPDTTLIDKKAWTRAWRKAISVQPYNHPPWQHRGEEFSAFLAAHLRASRGVDAEAVLAVPGSNAALRALAVSSGLTRCYMESPCYPDGHAELTRAGLESVFVPVDVDGLRVDMLGTAPGLVYTTPAHQYPLGYRLSVARRAELVAWARRTGSFVIEDDYDGEFRYGVAPLPAVRSIPGASDCVAYVGTASKILTPSLGAAWLIPPRPLHAGVERYLQENRLAVPPITRDALTALMQADHLPRHLARATREYRHRRDILLAALAAHCPNLDVTGIEAGLHVSILLPPACDDNELAGALAATGWLVDTISRCPQANSGSVNGLIVGFALITGDAAQRFAEALAELYAEITSRRRSISTRG